MVAIIDYGVGNLFSLRCSLEKIGAQVLVTKESEQLQYADKLILPGVGAFEDAAKKLRESDLDQVIKDEVQKEKSQCELRRHSQSSIDRGSCPQIWKPVCCSFL